MLVMNASAIRPEDVFSTAGIGPYAIRTVPQMFSTQAAATPHALAVQCGPDTLTYRELDGESNQLARYLQARGVGPEVPVGLYVERSNAFVAGALAIMKAGGAYLPLDPGWPAERVAAILRDAQAPVLVSHRWKPAGLPPGMWSTLDLDVYAPQIANESRDPLRETVTAGQLAYIIYTSGSTGQPKGVEITHGNLASLIEWHLREFTVAPSDRASQLAGLGFDAAVWEIWPYLAAGSSLHLAAGDDRRSPEALRDWLVEQQITMAFVPTAIAEGLITLPWPSSKLRWMLTGGEALRRYPVPGLPFTLVNNYGPTECTVLATSGIVPAAADASEPPSIGRPIPGAQVHILDAQLAPVEPGEPGEIYIAGPGVARGYRNQPAMTAAKFFPNPFGPGSLYCTGDRGRLRPDGEIAFLGRSDDQIKIRGYRIEPEEIVVALNRHPQIRSSIVIPRADSLAAYLVLDSGASLTASILREFLSATLPDYMIPSAFVRLDRLPLTTSGKCDKRALPEPTPGNTLPLHAQTSAAAGDIESRLLNIVGALVGSSNISPEDNFFFIGGHSMLAAQVLVRIRQDFGAALTLRQLFQAPTVAALSKEIRKLSVRNSCAGK